MAKNASHRFISLLFVLPPVVIASLGYDIPAVSHVTFVNRGFCDTDQLGDEMAEPSAFPENTSLMECAVICAQDDRCIGFKHPGRGRGACTPKESSPYFLEDCFQSAPEMFLQKEGICHNSGTWSETTGSCYCAMTGLWVGDYCSSIPVACDDFLRAGYPNTPQAIASDPHGASYYVRTECTLDSLELTSIARFASFRITSFPALNRSWVEMENGFEDTFATWIGLKAMHYHIEKVRHKSRFLQISFKRAHQPTLAFRYHGILVSDASDGYKLSFSNQTLYSPDFPSTDHIAAPSCLREANGSRFSTFDRDVDTESNDNCAVRAGAGFWYRRCRPLCHPWAVSFNLTPTQPFNYGSFRLGPWAAIDLSTTLFWAGNFDRTSIELSVKN